MTKILFVSEKIRMLSLKCKTRSQKIHDRELHSQNLSKSFRVLISLVNGILKKQILNKEQFLYFYDREREARGQKFIILHFSV